MRYKTKNHRICATCAYGVNGSKECQHPDLSPDVFSYVEPTIENTATLRYVLTGIDRNLLQSGMASKVVAYRAATHTGTCAYFIDKMQRTRPTTDNDLPLNMAVPVDFPNGYKKKNGQFYKTDSEGNVTEIRNIFGCDITDRADINLVFGCKPPK